MGAAVAVMLAVWNLVRWYAGRRSPPTGPTPFQGVRRPRERRAEPDRPAEYNPEFDFNRDRP